MADDNSFSEYQQLLDGLRMDILEINTFSRAQRFPPYLDFSDPTTQSLH